MSTALVTQIITIVCGLITPRLILTSFGSTYNGVSSSAAQFLGMLNILTLGITGATRVALYKPLAENDTLAVSRIMKASKVYMRKVALCVVIYAAVLCAVYPLIATNDLTWVQNAMLIAIVSIGTFANYFFGVNNTTLLQAAQCTYIAYLGDIVKVVVNTLSIAILIWMNCSIYMVRFGSSLIYLIVPLVISVYINKKFSLTNKCEPDNSGIKGRKAVALHSIANLIHNNTALVILTFFVNSKMISVYTVYYSTVSQIKMLMRVFTSGMEASFGDMWVKKERDTLLRSFRTYEYLLYTLTTVIFSCVGVLLVPFIRVYTLGVNDVNYIMPLFAVLITVAEGVYCIRQPYLTLIYATGSYSETKWSAMAEAVINLAVSLIFVSFMGISGVMLGTLCANVFCTVMFAHYASKHLLKRSIGVVIRRVIWLLACVLITSVSDFLIRQVIDFEVSWLGWILEGVMVFSVSVISAIIMSLIFYREDFMNLFRTFVRVFKKGR